MIFSGDKPLEPGKSIPLNQVSSLTLKVLPDSAFAASHPNDVNYTAYWRMYVRTGSTLGPPREGSGEVLPHGSMAYMRPGDAISIEIDHVVRTDASGRRENVKLDGKMKFLSVMVK